MPSINARFRMQAALLALAGLGLLAACGRGGSEPATPADPPSTELAGRQIAERLCAGCHAIGADDTSGHADAPAFRTLSQNYPVRYLEEAFAEGILVGHPDMPEFQFEPDQVEQLMVYLESVQVK